VLGATEFKRFSKLVDQLNQRTISKDALIESLKELLPKDLLERMIQLLE
jgi:DNA-binding HxlR family transcriptional regulator